MIFSVIRRNPSEMEFLSQEKEFVAGRTSALTSGKVAKQNKFSSAYQLANIQIFCIG